MIDTVRFKTLKRVQPPITLGLGLEALEFVECDLCAHARTIPCYGHHQIISCIFIGRSSYSPLAICRYSVCSALVGSRPNSLDRSARHDSYSRIASCRRPSWL